MQTNMVLIINSNSAELEVLTKIAEKYFFKVFVATNYKEAQAVIKSQSLNGIISAAHISGGNSIDLIENQNLRGNIIPAIISTDKLEERLVLRSYNAHIIGFIQSVKRLGHSEEGIKKLHRYIRDQQELRFFKQSYSLMEKTKNNLKLTYSISNRENDVIEMALHPTSNQTIANDLSITKGTVRRHFENIFRKLSINSKEELRSLVKDLNQSLYS